MTAVTQDHRRHAIQIAAALPNGTKDALIVLRLAERLVRDFLIDTEDKAPAASIVRLVEDN
ncbi:MULTISPECIES: hypothetical protein [unclassified Bradyrhizobium]